MPKYNNKNKLKNKKNVEKIKLYIKKILQIQIWTIQLSYLSFKNIEDKFQ